MSECFPDKCERDRLLNGLAGRHADLAAKDARIAELERRYVKLDMAAESDAKLARAEIEALRKRVGELEALVEKLSGIGIVPAFFKMESRAEQAEAQLAVATDRLRWALHELREHQADYHHRTPWGDIDKASAGLQQTAPATADIHRQSSRE